MSGIRRWQGQWNVANAVTVARIVAIPVLLGVLFYGGGHQVWWRVAAAVLFIAIAATDRVDGHLARSRGLVTDLGKLLDPIADKALIIATLVGLNLLGDLPWWVTAVIVVRELGITIMRLFLVRIAVIPASRGGKLKTVLQIAAVTGFLLPLAALPLFFAVTAWALMGAAIVVTVYTGVEYAVLGWRMTREQQAG